MTGNAASAAFAAIFVPSTATTPVPQ